MSLPTKVLYVPTTSNEETAKKPHRKMKAGGRFGLGKRFRCVTVSLCFLSVLLLFTHNLTRLFSLKCSSTKRALVGKRKAAKLQTALVLFAGDLQYVSWGQLRLPSPSSASDV
ncbi:hypothetical protein BaRGS_00039522 [Batillaria attramentaria]|uniref:Transmembrane protein n=1 Tax=Batillaria attramentaria TaxID=370345 RepID=A0ABD0J2R1_9CAEN